MKPYVTALARVRDHLHEANSILRTLHRGDEAPSKRLASAADSTRMLVLDLSREIQRLLDGERELNAELKRLLRREVAR
jgi:hypothetical protein